jgi:hypothetical protein
LTLGTLQALGALKSLDALGTRGTCRTAIASGALIAGGTLGTGISGWSRNSLWALLSCEPRGTRWPGNTGVGALGQEDRGDFLGVDFAASFQGREALPAVAFGRTEALLQGVYLGFKFAAAAANHCQERNRKRPGPHSQDCIRPGRKCRFFAQIGPGAYH